MRGRNPGADSIVIRALRRIFRASVGRWRSPRPWRGGRRQNLAAVRRGRRLPGGAENAGAKSSISMPCGRFSGRSSARAVPAPLRGWRRRGVGLAAARRERRLAGGAEIPGVKSSISNALRQVFRAIVTAQVGAAFRSNLVLRSDPGRRRVSKDAPVPAGTSFETPASRAPQDEDPQWDKPHVLGRYGRSLAWAVPAPLRAGRRRGVGLAAALPRATVSRRRGKPGREIKHFNALRQVFRAIVNSRAGVASVAWTSVSTRSSPSPVGTSDREARSGTSRSPQRAFRGQGVSGTRRRATTTLWRRSRSRTIARYRGRS